MITVTTPYPQFAELDGSPLDNGAVYIGTAGLNSETNPIAVFWDNAGTQPAAQPLRTRSGLIARNGAPARVYVNAAAYSLLVKDKQGRLIAYEASISSAVGTDNIDNGSITEAKLATAVTDKLNGALQRTGGTMTGALVLAANAANALEAVPKQQADLMVAAVRNKLASLSVTVNANAMTATLQPETLDFRSTTMASGTPVSRTAAVAVSLTVPSAATLGTVNGQAARIVWGWLDNAGTLEPFVANLAGGVNLDETTLISTTAISGTANNSGVIYSQTARTNVAFRVRGFCDITQATAGTWSTGPTLVQGAGGQALAAMSSLGYGQTWQNLTASRAFGTTYYNTTGKPIFVFVSLASMPASSVATLTVGGVTASSCSMGGTAGATSGTLFAVIPPSVGYSVANGGATLGTWSELR